MDDETPKTRAYVSAARLSGGSAGGSVPLQAPKDELLWKAVMDEPWDTSLGWTDAQLNEPELSHAEVDVVWRRAILELHDANLARFFRVEDFGDSYSRTPSENEFLTREQLLEVIGAGTTETGKFRSVPFLGIRATVAGRERVFMLWPEDRERWESSTRRQT